MVVVPHAHLLLLFPADPLAQQVGFQDQIAGYVLESAQRLFQTLQLNLRVLLPRRTMDTIEYKRKERDDRLTTGPAARSEATKPREQERSAETMRPSTEPQEQELWRSVSGQGAPLLLIHGTGGDGDAWHGAVEHLTRRHRVIRYDRRGYSRSRGKPHPRCGYYRRHAEDAVALLDALGVERTAVCGWSAGGLVALELAISNPLRVSSLVLYEPPFLVARHISLKPLVGYAWSWSLRLLGRRRAAADAFLRVAMGRDYGRLRPAARDRLSADADTVLHELDGGTGEDLTAERLRTIACPVTLLVGDETSPFLIAASDRLSRMLPRAALIRVPRAGHGMPVLQPLAFAAVLERAVAAQTR